MSTFQFEGQMFSQLNCQLSEHLHLLISTPAAEGFAQTRLNLFIHNMIQEKTQGPLSSSPFCVENGVTRGVKLLLPTQRWKCPV